MFSEVTAPVITTLKAQNSAWIEVKGSSKAKTLAVSVFYLQSFLQLFRSSSLFCFVLLFVIFFCFFPI